MMLSGQQREKEAKKEHVAALSVRVTKTTMPGLLKHI